MVELRGLSALFAGFDGLLRKGLTADKRVS